MRGLFAMAVGLLAVAISSDASARTPPLGAEEVVALARTLSPDARIAATRVTEARGRLAGARVLATDNPTLEGVRSAGSEPAHTTLELSVPLGGGIRRSRRIEEARAGVDREEALATNSELEVVGAALRAYYETLRAEQSLAIETVRHQLAKDLVGIAENRYRVGDVARLEVVAAESELSRAQSGIFVAQRDVAEARLALARILGLPSGSGFTVAGELGDRSLLDASILGPPERRPDVLAAERDLQSANAALSLAGASLIPDLAFRLNYERTGGDGTFSPGLALSLPVFDRGQGARAEARARRNRASIQLEARRAYALAEVESARAAYASIVASAREIEERALPRAMEVEELARQGYEAGKLDLPSLLVVRTGALDTRREYADRLLDAAHAGITLTIALGACPASTTPMKEVQP